MSNLESGRMTTKCVPLALRRWACKVQKMGRVSKGIILPKDICLAYALQHGDVVVLELQPNRILINFDSDVVRFVAKDIATLRDRSPDDSHN